ncbi:hypothetical protein [Psychrobacillus sp. L3]|uniref:hypothetical protein n=1 Tax=Psychrobacillus sp. L3 TaxID=3236891 RepID=UPI0036F338C4
MEIREILELTKTKPIAEIAKEYLTIGEKPARAALKRAGCYTIVGQPGWIFDDTENPSNLDRSIYEIADEVKSEKKTILKDRANLDSNQLKYTLENAHIYRKRHSFDLDVALVKELKLHCVKQDKTLYEAVETAIQNYLTNDREDGTSV